MPRHPCKQVQVWVPCKQPGATVKATANVIVDGISIYANATALASLQIAGTGLTAKDSAHMLLAYSTGPAVNIVDAKFINKSAVNPSDTANLTVIASDMDQLMGVSMSSLHAHTIGLIRWVH
jgi:hypothetical protein